MKIIRTKEIDRFFNRCLHNIQNETKNEFLGMPVTKQTEKEIQRRMKKAGFLEYQGSVDTWPSLYISSKEYMSRPYHKTIQLDKIQSKEFAYKKELVQADELFSLSSIQFDPDRELNDSMRLVALDEPMEVTILYQNNEVWMLDVPSEAETIDPYAKKAHGNILTFGLGIGYYPFMAMLNPSVEKITVIEKSKPVIELFNLYLRPQFPNHITLEIIEGDAFDYFNEKFLSQYDSVFVDIWQSNQDGLVLIEKLLENYLPDFNQVDFWIESSCFEIIPTLIFLYFEALTRNKHAKVYNKDDRRIMRKIDTYFRKIDQTIDDVDQLKDYMYNLKIHREILSIRL